MKTIEMLNAIESREERIQIRNGLRADVDALKKVYRETREDGPAATVAAYIAAVGYNRAVAIVSTLVNRHAWDGRISRRAAAWAEEQPEAWDEQTSVDIGLYIDDVIHLAHFDQIAREIMKTTPPEDDDKRPATIQAENTQESEPAEAPEAEAAPQEEPEAAPASFPESVALAPEAFRAVVESAPRCGLLFDLQGDCLRYKTEDGRKRCIYTESVTIEHGDRMARIKYRNGSSRGQITLDREHDCFPVAAVVAGTVSPSDALWDILTTAVKLHDVFDSDRDYFRAARKPSGSRKEEAAGNMKYGAKLADLAACIIKNAADGIPMFIEQIAAELEAIAADAREIGQGLTPAKHAEAVAAWIRETFETCLKAARESAEQRRKIISESNEAQEAEAAPQVEPEAAQDPEAGKTPEAPEELRYYAAYYNDFPYEPRIFKAKNKKEAEEGARKYRRAWSLPALLRVDTLTEEEAAKLEAEAKARWHFLYEKEAAPESVEAPEAEAAQEEPEPVEDEPGTVIMKEVTYDIRTGKTTSRRVLYSTSNGLQEIREDAEAAQEEPEPAPEPAALMNQAPAPVALMLPAPALVPKLAEAPEAEAAPRVEQKPAPDPEAEAEDAPRRQAPPKPPRGPAKPLDFIGEILSGPGWRIVFDTSLQRTRVILAEETREKAAPLAEAAGFYYSATTDSWHKKLTHKAHRAAIALAEKLRAAC